MLEDQIEEILKNTGLLSLPISKSLIRDLAEAARDYSEQDITAYIPPDNHAIISLREIEELLRVTRELIEAIDSKPEKTGTEMIRFDELRQIDYRLTELLIEYRN